MKRFALISAALVASATPLSFITAQSSLALGANLINNPSVEQAVNNQPVGWTNAKTGTNTTAFNYLSTGHTGSHSLQVQMTKRSSGNAKWVFTPIAVTPNTNYTFTNWYQSNIQSHLQVAVTKTGGTTSNIASNNQPASSSWKQASISFKTPANAKSLTIYHYINSVGQLTTDDFDLETPVVVPPTVQVTAPANNATISGTQIVTASATDSAGISNVQFKLDGANLGAADTTVPYSVDWDSTTATNGSHILTAVATNISNLNTVSSNVTVDVQNQATPPPVLENIIFNPSSETPDSANPNIPAQWLSNNWGTSTAQFSYLNTGHSGGRSIKTEITSYSSGDAKWYFNSVAIQVNKSYTFTDYYQASVDTEVVAQYADAQGNLSYVWLGAAPASTNWTTFGITFTTPASATKLTIFHLIAKVGWLVVDDVNLITTPPPPVFTGLIANPSAEYASVSSPQVPSDWTVGSWGSNTPSFEYLNEGHTGNHSLKVTVSNYVSGDAKWYFNPVTTLHPGSQYRFSTWYKTNTIPHAVAMYVKSDGTEQYFGMPNPQPNGTADWQFYTDTFTIPLDAKYVSAFLFLPNNGWLQTDDYSLVDYHPVGFNRSLLALTFDDGYEGNVTNALPLLNQYGFKTTQCYETQDIEGIPGASDDIMAFFNSGHEICSHTVTHPFLTQISQSQLTYELTHAQQYLQGLIGVPVRDFASPYGDYNQAVDTEIAKYYRSHRTVDEGFNSKDNFDIFRLRVQNMTPTTSLAQVQSWIDQAKATNTWLILVYHSIVTSNPEAFDTYQSDFAQQLQAISQSGITVKTWSSALDELTAQL